MPNERRTKSYSRIRRKAANKAAKKAALKPTKIAQELPVGPHGAGLYFEGCNRNLRKLLGLIQSNGPEAYLAVVYMFKLAAAATLNCGVAACQNGTAAFAETAAEQMDFIAIMKGNQTHVPQLAEALEKLSGKTFQSYRSRAPRKNIGESPEVYATRCWVVDRVNEFWRGVITRGRCEPPIPDNVRQHLLLPENRCNGREWAKKLLEINEEIYRQLPIPVRWTEVFDGSHREEFFKVYTPKDRPSNAAQGFVDFVAKRFDPLLRRETKRAEMAYNILLSERAVPLTDPVIGTG